jgi:hypothetical protein
LMSAGALLKSEDCRLLMFNKPYCAKSHRGRFRCRFSACYL